MEITKKVFWREAVKGGTIIGLVGIAFAILRSALQSADAGFWLTLVRWIDNLVFIFLIYGFTKKISSSASPVRGFPYGRCMGFVVSMMLFYGILMGVYAAVYNNFIDPEGVRAAIDELMVVYQDMLPADMFDAYYGTMSSMMFNPIALVFSGILSGVIGGALVGLLTSAFAKRDPDVFAE